MVKDGRESALERGAVDPRVRERRGVVEDVRDEVQARDLARDGRRVERQRRNQDVDDLLFSLE